MADIFISYSRQDSRFVELLRAALIGQGRSVWIDTADILPTSQWRQDIIDAIDAASAVLFVLSPDWLASEVCQRELQYAVDARKKIVPIVYRDVDHRLVNPELANINWIFARSGDNDSTALQQILFAIDTDLGYWREGSDILVRANQWQQNERKPAYTLRGEALRQAEQWLAAGASRKPSPSQQQIEFINAGRRATAERQRTTIGALSAGIIITLILSIVASGLFVVTRDQNKHITTQAQLLAGQAIASEAKSQFSSNKIQLAMLLAVAAYREGDSSDPITRAALASVVNQFSHLDQITLDASRSSVGNSLSYIGYSKDSKVTGYVDSQNGIIDRQGQPILYIQPPALPNEAADHLFSGALSPDGSLMVLKQEGVVGSTDVQLALWDTTTGKQVRALDGPNYEVHFTGEHHDIVFSPDGHLVATTLCDDANCAGTQLTLWDVATGKIVAKIPGKYPINTNPGDSVSFSADSRYVAFNEFAPGPIASSPGRVVIWDITQNRLSSTIDSPYQITAMSFTPTSNVVAVAGFAGPNGQTQQVTFWDITKHVKLGAPTFINDINTINVLDFDAQSVFMMTADGDHTIQLWGLTSNFDTYTFGEDVTDIRSLLSAAAINPNANQIITSSLDGAIVSWRLTPYTSASPDAALTFGTQPQITFSPDSKSLIFATDAIKQWNLQQETAGTIAAGPLLPNLTVIDLAVSPDGQHYAVVTNDGQIEIFNRATGKPEGSPWQAPDQSTDITGISFSPDGHTLAGCDFAAITRCLLWDTQTHAVIKSFGDANTTYFAVAFSPDGHSLALSESDNTGKTHDSIQIYDLQQQHVIASLDIKENQAFELAWSPNGHDVGEIDNNGRVLLWEYRAVPSSRNPILVTNVPSTLTLPLDFMAPPPGADPTSQWLMVPTPRSLETWQVDSHGNASRYIDPIFFPDFISSAAASPDGHYIAGVNFSNGLVSTISLKPEDWVQQACLIANANLTPEQWKEYVQAPFANLPTPPPFKKLCPGR